MATTLKQVITLLPELSAEDRAEVVRWCDALGAQPKGLADNEPACHAFDEFSGLLAQYYQAPTTSLNWFIRNRGLQYRLLLRATDRAWDLVITWWPGARKNTRLALLRYLCRTVFQVSTRRVRRVSWQHLIKSLADVEVSINDAFPGWLAEGTFQRRVLAQVGNHTEQRQEASDAWYQSNTQTRSDARQRASNRTRLLHHSG